MVTVQRAAGPAAYTRPAALVALVAALVDLVFPIDPTGATSTAGTMHNVLGNLAFFTLPAAAVLVGHLAARVTDPASSPTGAATSPGRAAPTLLGWLVLALSVLVLAAGSLAVFGLAQRAYLVAAAVWVVVTALAALRSRSGG